MNANVIYSPKTNRTYVRKFDHDEARARYVAGETVGRLAREYGVSWAAVARVVDPRVAKAMKESIRRSIAGTCETCGAACIRADAAMKRKHNPDGRTLCARCRSAENTTRVRRTSTGEVEAVRCRKCRRWLPLRAFSHGTANLTTTDGIHSHCRSCNTITRQAYRERHKIPCDRCGSLRLPANETRGTTGLCRRCYDSTRATAAS